MHQNESNVPNLDALPDDELRAFAVNAKNRSTARELFPERPPLYTVAAQNLSHYAWNTLTARQCRTRGDIAAAQMYEGIADRIYNQLPPFARW